MTPSSRLKRIDQIGISLLMLFLVLSLLFRASPISIMNPGFPILRQSNWGCLMSFSFGCKPPERITNVYDYSKVSYVSLFHVEDYSQTDTSFTVVHTVTRFSNSTEAMNALKSSYEIYVNEHLPNPDYELSHKFITNIPNLTFSSKADKYYLWCEQLSPNKDFAYVPEYVGEKVDTCYYWSTYGRFYSELRVSMWPIAGGGRHFAVEIFSDALHRADRKLSIARWWFR